MSLSLTVDVEEIYHDLWPPAEEKILKHYGYKLPKGTFIRPMQSILKMFEQHHVHSTFFVLGEVSEAFPEIVEEIHDLGHEIASHGYMHKDFTKVPFDELEKMEKKNRSLLAKMTGETPKGFRAPNFKINTKVLDLLEGIGYLYDSSVVPSIKIPRWFGYFGAPLYPYRPGRQNLVKQSQSRVFYEVPVAVFPYIRLPAGGGWFLRNFGANYVKIAIRFLLRKKLPVILYIHPLDVHSDVPRLKGIPFHVTRHCGEYVMKAIKQILQAFKCKKLSIADMLEEYGL